MQATNLPVTKLYQQDISKEFFYTARNTGIIACDIETSGLQWRVDKVATCQFYIPDGPAAIVRIEENTPRYIVSLLSDQAVKKVFHHAMFDLRFMVYRWQFSPQNIACTKIASKLLDKHLEKYSLQILLDRYLQIQLDKTQQTSNWLLPNLTKAQKMYAIKDVLYLPALLEILEQELRQKGLLDLMYACFAHIPTRLQLEILGYEDVYLY
jgi:ribonuclease D